LSYTDDFGNRRRRQFSTRAEAEREQRRLGQAPKTTYGKYAKEALQRMQLSLRPKTHQAYCYHYLAVSRLHDLDLDQIDTHTMRAHQGYRIASGKTPATANREVAFVSAVLSRAVQDGLLARNPLIGLRRERLRLDEPRPLRFLSIHEMMRLENECEDPLLGIVEVALGTGMRMGEIFQLTWPNVDIINSYVQILGKAKDDYRQVPISRSAKRAIKRQPTDSLYVFPGKEGLRTSCRSSFGRACERAGLHDVTFHTLRHTFASHAVMNGMDLRTLQMLLGHAKIDMVLRYSHLADRHAESVLDRVEAKLEALKHDAEAD